METISEESAKQTIGLRIMQRRKQVGMKQKELAEALGGGVVAGSRPTVENGWLTEDRQVGQTGKTVHPRIYVALGISGAIQHKAGMQDSDMIIAVNANANAPIFEVANYGIVGDLYEVVPKMIAAINDEKAKK